jgi:hypothetical protein
MRIIAFLLAFAAAIGASQAPEFAQQYRQRLGGAIDELNRVIANFNADAARSGIDQTQALAQMATNSDRLVRDQSVSMAETILRHARLEEQQQAFEEGGAFVRVAALLHDYDAPLMQSTARQFEPAMPTTAEGVVFAVGGFVVIYAVLRLIGFLFRPRRRRRHQHQTLPEHA